MSARGIVDELYASAILRCRLCGCARGSTWALERRTGSQSFGAITGTVSLLAKLSQRVAVGKNLNKQALAKAESIETRLGIYHSLDAERVPPPEGKSNYADSGDKS